MTTHPSLRDAIRRDAEARHKQAIMEDAKAKARATHAYALIATGRIIFHPGPRDPQTHRWLACGPSGTVTARIFAHAEREGAQLRVPHYRPGTQPDEFALNRFVDILAGGEPTDFIDHPPTANVQAVSSQVHMAQPGRGGA